MWQIVDSEAERFTISLWLETRNYIPAQYTKPRIGDFNLGHHGHMTPIENYEIIRA